MRFNVWHRIGAGFFLPILMAVLFLFPAQAQGEEKSVTVLFTHDLHAAFLPRTGADRAESGGFARLHTLLQQQRKIYPNAVTVDGGDFSMGSLFQVLYSDRAPELVTMGQMGYDAVTVGNHEFDYGPQGFARMLQAAKDSGGPLPTLLMANYTPQQESPHREEVLRALSRYGASQTMVIQRGGVSIGVFGIMGDDSHISAPESQFQLEAAAQAARRCVAALRAEGAEFIIALSHSGTDTNRKKSEDEQLALKVEGIDLIVSGHTHTTLEEPIRVGSTYIVSAGANCESLGSITLGWSGDGEKALLQYALIPVDERVAEETETTRLVEQWKDRMETSYLSALGYTYDQVLGRTDFDLDTPVSGVQAGNALGELISDAYRWAAEQAEGKNHVPVTAAITADGLIRASLLEGEITVSQVFDVLSLGIGPDGQPGYPLVSVWLTGKELRAALEVDASVTPLMHSAQLYISGLQYQFNTLRIFFNRVTESAILLEDGTTAPIEEDKLYRVVTSLFSAQMLASVEDKSKGLLSVVVKDETGQPIVDVTEHILRDREGNEVKEWQALAGYLASFDEKDGVSTLPSRYKQPDGRKDVVSSLNPVMLFKGANVLTMVAALCLFVLAGLAGLLTYQVTKRLRRKRYGGGKRRRRRR